MNTETYKDLAIARDLTDRGDPDAAWDIVQARLMDDADCVPALILGYTLMDKARRWGLAYQLAARAMQLAPKMSATWTNYGKACQSLYRPETEKAYQTALMLSSSRPEVQLLNLNNLAAFYADSGDYEKCEAIAKKALEFDPEHRKALGNLGIAQLGQRKWAEGWKNYAAILGSDVRKLMKYHKDPEPEWDGAPDQRIVVYGEQGLGDELSFASMLPDAIRISRKVVVDCDKRLMGLFKRSFPDATVYGTRWDHDSYGGAEWEEHDKIPQASISIGQLGRIFRTKDEDFPGTPYLVADPERLTMWREFFKTKRKPIIGIAWSGGLSWTAARFRKWKLEELQPIFNAVDAHWVCLQYKQDCVKEIAAFEGATIHDYPFATRSKDYDDTAALVKSCDLVIGMQTSVMHLAAALGVETWCFVNRRKQWRYGTDEMLWYKSMKLYRQSEKDVWPIEDAARVLRLRYGDLSLKSA